MAGRDYLKFISYLQIIGIILVVAGHSLHEYPDGGMHGETTLLHGLIYSFHMPLFMFVSGFLLLYSMDFTDRERSRPGRFILDKLGRLMLPMVVLTVVTFIPRVMFGSIADNEVEMSAKSFFHSFIYFEGLIIPFFWYLQASFVLLLLFFLIFYYAGKLKFNLEATGIALCVLFLIYALLAIPTTSFFSLNKVKEMGFFFATGVLYALYFRRVDRVMPWTRWWMAPVCAILWATAYFTFESRTGEVVCAVLGIMAAVSLAKLLEERERRFLDHLQSANYLIFLLSWYFNIGAQQVLSHYVDWPWWTYSLLSLFAGIYIPWLGYRYLERHQQSRWIRLTAILLGQRFRQAPLKEREPAS